jgi:hypothetical protein
MTASPDAYVPWSVFEWFIGIFITAFGGFFALLGWFFKRHLREDDQRFEMQEAHIQIKHAENIASIQQIRGDVLAGQSNLATQFTAIRRTLDDVLLQRRMEPRE